MPARASGGIAASPADLAKWARALFTGRLLAPKQQRELESLVSQKTGRPIKTTTREDPGGFGLGVSQSTAPVLGTVWIYLASTLGSRSLLTYVPRSGTAIAIGANSLPEQDHLPRLGTSVYLKFAQAGVS